MKQQNITINDYNYSCCARSISTTTIIIIVIPIEFHVDENNVQLFTTIIALVFPNTY